MRVVKWSLTVLLLLLIQFDLIFAQNSYYISPNGSDSNDGSIGKPWRQLIHAFNTMSPSDTVFLRQGNYSFSETWIKDGLGGNN